jgi:hypothetical protein
MAGCCFKFNPGFPTHRGMIVLPCYLAGLLLYMSAASKGWAQEGPYFVTYDHYLEERGDLEIEFEPTTARPSGGNRFFSGLVEFEYGATNWWTTELYLEGQSTVNDSTVFSGYRIENRFRLLPGRHRVNPVLYTEYDGLSADKALTEVVGFDSQDDALEPNSTAHRKTEHEVETRLILSGDYKRWNITWNLIGEKNLAHEPWEFGYAAGVSRPLGRAASRQKCGFCPQQFRVGVEVYGGLGTADRFTMRGTSQYIAPALAWSLPAGPRFRISPALGLTGSAYKFVLRMGVSYEFEGFGQHVAKFLGASR